jgi:hypothetical protein
MRLYLFIPLAIGHHPVSGCSMVRLRQNQPKFIYVLFITFTVTFLFSCRLVQRITAIVGGIQSPSLVLSDWVLEGQAILFNVYPSNLTMIR